MKNLFTALTVVNIGGLAIAEPFKLEKRASMAVTLKYNSKLTIAL